MTDEEIEELKDELKSLQIEYDDLKNEHQDCGSHQSELDDRIYELEKITERMPDQNTLYDEECWGIILKLYENLNLEQLQKISDENIK